MTITDLLKANGIASNDFQASHIANGLKLWECETDEERLERARLYRDWRNSQYFKKSDTKSCYEKAIAGEKVPQQPLLKEALHSNTENDESGIPLESPTNGN